MRYKVKRNIEDDKGTSHSKKTRGSGFIDTNAGQKATVFYKTFQNILFFILYFEIKLNQFHGKTAPKHRNNLAAWLTRALT